MRYLPGGDVDNCNATITGPAGVQASGLREIEPLAPCADKKSDASAASGQILSARQLLATEIQAGTLGMRLASCSPRMRVLEARFHPHSKKSGSPVAVARVLCDQELARIEPIPPPLQRLEPFDPDALMKKLTFLVESAKPQPFEQLSTLRSEFWSFTEVSARLSRTG